jgi:hypothetical protein
MKKVFLVIINLWCVLPVFSQTKFQLEKLEDFTKIYGIVRYFHPSDEVKSLNWDVFLLYSVNEILKIEDQRSFESFIKQHFSSIAPSVSFNQNKYEWKDTMGLIPVFWIHRGLAINRAKDTGYKSFRTNKNEIKKEVKRTIKWDKYVELNLNQDFDLVIPTVVYGDTISTYPKGEIRDYKINNIKDFSYNITSLANVIQAWNILKHFYPYQQEVKIDWNDLLKSSLKDAYNDTSRLDSYYTLKRLMSKIDDGHGRINNQKLNSDLFYLPGIAVKYIDDKLIVTKAEDKIGVKVGEIIEKINNKPVKEIHDSIIAYNSGSQQYKNAISHYQFLNGKKNSSVEIELRNGNKIMLSRENYLYNNNPFYRGGSDLSHSVINDNTYYLDIDLIKPEEIDNLLPTINKYENLIIDVRGYPKKTLTLVLGLLMSTQDTTKWMCKKEILLPDFRFDKNLRCVGLGPLDFTNKKINSNVVFLADGRSISAAETLLQVVKHYKLGAIIGQPTAGTNGNITCISILDGFILSYTGMHVVNPDHTQLHTIGVLPDIHVKETVEDIQRGNDPFIQKAVEYFNKP